MLITAPSKSDGTLRFYTNFCKVHSVIVSGSFPLPRMEDCIDSISPAAAKGYWQVPLTRATAITAFITSDNFL